MQLIFGLFFLISFCSVLADDKCHIFGDCRVSNENFRFLPEFAENLDLNAPVVNKITFRIPLRRQPEDEFKPTSEDVQIAVTRSYELFNETEALLLSTLSPLERMKKSPSQYWSVHTKSDAAARERSFPAHVAVHTTGLMKSTTGEVPNKLHPVLESICPRDTVQYCENKKYRSIDGSCNNVANPMWGATYSPFQRFIEADYADSVSSFRGSKVAGRALPNVRLLSTALFREPKKRQKSVTAFVTHWAHFIYTDLVHVAERQLLDGDIQYPIPCCKDAPVKHPECASIPISSQDPRLGNLVDCMPYTRSLIAPREGCPLGKREQANLASSFLDASTVYGSTKQKTRQLRTLRDGQLKTSTKSMFDDVFPATIDPLTASFSTVCNPAAGQTCFLSGSEHVNFLPTIAAMHTLWIRQHNKIASKLLQLNKQWNDEKLFQESRRIVIAQLQHITFNEFLPLLVGRESWKRYGLNPKESFTDSDEYNLLTDSSTLNTFGAVVGQFFFTLFEGRLPEADITGDVIPGRPLSDYFNDPSSLVFADKMNGIIRALLREKPPKMGLQMTEELRERLFKGHSNVGLDMAALILQTGRDHGIPSYTVWRDRCGGKKIRSFSDLEDDVQNPSWLIPVLEKTFASVEDVDLFILGLAEKPVRGALVGPTFSCILSLQFRRTKRGDRFWYENSFQPNSFTQDQQMEVKKTTLARIICDNTGISSVQPKVFEAVDIYDNYPVACNSSMLPHLDLKKHWQDDDKPIQMPVTMATIKKAIHLGAKEVEERRRRESNNIKMYQGTFQSGDPLYSYGRMMRAKREATTQAKMSAILLESTKLLLSGQIDGDTPLSVKLDAATLQQILPTIDVSSFVNNFTAFVEGGTPDECLPRDLPCDHTLPYRTFDGWCNNLRNPHFAIAFGPLKHLLEPVYEDGIDEPRSLAKSGHLLPSPRVISNAIHLDLPFDHQKGTHMVMQFGQLLDHEMTHSPVERGPNDEILNCTRCDSASTLSVHCMPLPVPENDPHFPTHDENGERRCLPFARSLLGQLNLGYRNQINQLTAYLDGSAFYGSTRCEAAALRSFRGGELNFTDLGDFNHEALPQGDQEQDCRGKPKYPCFHAGDARNSHQPGLTTMHTLFLREHNRISRQFQLLNPLWSDEKTYQESRKIIGAMFQHIVYSEYLPKLIGNEFMSRYQLVPLKNGYFGGYDDNCDASISHPFATAAFRFGHTLVRRLFPRLTSFYRNHSSPVDLVDNFNNMESVYDHPGGGIDSILVGLLGTPSMAFDRHITAALRNHLFGKRGEPLSGMDLISINILRARDHGVQPYNAFREFCGLDRVHTFGALSNEMDPSAIDALQQVYESVDDIDLFPGLLSESPMPGAIMPPTMACIIAEQMSRLKKCDRFYYENDVPETRFSVEQLQEIRKIKLGSILCQNAQALIKIQPDVFSMPNELANAQIPCTDFPRISLEKWMDRGVCIVGNKQVPKGTTTRKSPCVSCTCTNDGPRCKTMIVGNCQKLINTYLFTDILQDMACLVQCSKLIRERAGRL